MVDCTPALGGKRAKFKGNYKRLLKFPVRRIKASGCREWTEKVQWEVMNPSVSVALTEESLTTQQMALASFDPWCSVNVSASLCQLCASFNLCSPEALVCSLQQSRDVALCS